MSPEMIGLIAISAFLILTLLEMPIAISISIGGTLGIFLLQGSNLTTHAIGSIPYSSIANYSLLVVPMYVLLGSLMSHTGIGARIYAVANRLVGKRPGGLAAGAVLATAAFSGISGSSAADVATFGRVSVNEMARNGYAKPYAAAVVAAAGTFAVLIPPSITIVMYAVVANESIGAMILAGVIPGVISAVALAGFVILLGRRGNLLQGGVVKSSSQPVGEPLTDSRGGAGLAGDWKNGDVESEWHATSLATPDAVQQASDRTSSNSREVREHAAAVLYAAILFAIVVGGLYAGIFTAVESGAMGAFAALIIAAIARKEREANFWKVLTRSLMETSNVTSMIFLLLIGGSMFSYMLAISRVPTAAVQWATSLSIPPALVIALILLLLLPLGAVLDGLSLLLLTVPIIAPIAVSMGFDGVWFGILVIKMIEIGLITPPVGTNAFIISGITRIPVEKVFRCLVPFVVLDLCVTSLFFAFPETVLWLPRYAGLL